MNVTAWANGLDVGGGGTGIVSHAGLGLLRRLVDKTGLTSGLSRALAAGRVLEHDRGRVLADLWCVIAGAARSISDFQVLANQKEAFGQVASVPTACRRSVQRAVQAPASPQYQRTSAQAAPPSATI